MDSTDDTNIVCYLLSMRYADAFGVAEGFSSIEAALQHYTKLEQKNQIDDDAVLVLTSSEQAISYAFPNYTSNISEFLELLSAYIHA